MNMINNEMTMPGSRVREGHASTVLSIVGRERMLPVVSAGTRFFMRGAFGWRTVASRIIAGDFDPASIERAVAREAATVAMINVAQCDDAVTRRVYLALIGGAGHEAFHRLYSQQGSLTTRAIGAAIAPVAANPSFSWGKYAQLLLDLQNVFEDTFIERIGNSEFPGVRTKLCDLADFIVRQEQESRVAAGNPAITVPAAVFTALRDIGLGYNTETVRGNLLAIKAECPSGYGLVAAGGVLHGILLRSIPDVSTPAAIAAAKRALLDGVTLTLALEALVLLANASQGKPGAGEPGKGEPGKGEPGKGEPGKGEPGKGEPGKGKPGEGKPGEGKPGEGKPGAGKPGEGKPGEGKPGEGKPGEGKPGEGKPGAGKPGAGKPGAGGAPSDSGVTAGEMLAQHAASGSGTLDSNSALEAGVRAENAKEAVTYEAAPYRPLTTAFDEIVRVKPQASNEASFKDISRNVRKGTAYLKTRLATVFHALENSGVEHGVRKGPQLSGRMLVNSHCEMLGGSMPTRAYMERAPQIDMSVAAAMVIDESSSMHGKLRETCAIAYTLGDALDGIGAKSMAVGFRAKSIPNGGLADLPFDQHVGTHRQHAMAYDIFKDWGESFKASAPRLREIRAHGGTPMSDGVEFALNELSKRPEGYRVMFVLTDGQPDSAHQGVLKTQLQRCAEAGILVVGVGLGSGSEYVSDVFHDSVYASNLNDLPKLIVAKLEALVRTRHTLAKRGRTVRAA